MRFQYSKLTANESEHKEGRELARKIAAKFKSVAAAERACSLYHGALDNVIKRRQDPGKQRLQLFRQLWAKIEAGEIKV
jgi:hypothetical protein